MKGKDWETDEGEDQLAKRIIAEALRARAEKIVNRISPIRIMFMSNWEGDTIYTFYQNAKTDDGKGKNGSGTLLPPGDVAPAN